MFVGYALVLGWGGVPVIWMGDELGLTNDLNWANEEGHANDNRWAHRPRLPWPAADRRYDGNTVQGRLFALMRHLVLARSQLEHLHASVAAEIPALEDPGVLPVLRRHPVGPMLGLYNMTETWRPWPGHRLAELGLAAGVDNISGETVRAGADGNIWLAPFGALWITAS